MLLQLNNDDIDLGHTEGQITMTPGEPDVACTQPGREESCRAVPLTQGKVAAKIGPPPDPVLPRDDLRAYAYEGDGSSSGSLGSAKSGMYVFVWSFSEHITPLSVNSYNIEIIFL